ncbi:uncharacterized protein RHOBADRAFT_52644 [Rhodotorula graminis WP1]|uniref:Uncharacterized protein n=1 Tax=Rhodotorula graminis (strain WP1) TaxID=578459 RepID=A0A194S7X9_RHOGW|nr:uncharacterized protein RHOBADRAFT_52644 [Rhodotorula graminis WP1]KPV76669.1 hypothetical protein RHOBADRAFT_52644 [Rhodotorula graminis WP1]
MSHESSQPADAGPDSSRAPAPSSLADSPLSPAQQQCLTPPSVRRREARIARCMVAAGARAEARRAAEGGGRAGERAGSEDEARLGYAADEVEARRVGRREAAWQGYEAEAAAYGGPQVGEGPSALVRPDGTLDWAQLDAVATADSANYAADVVGDGMLALGQAADEHVQTTLGSLDGLATFPPRQPCATLPSLPATLATTTQPPLDVLPLVLGALYVAARALGLGSRRAATANPSTASDKTRRSDDEHARRE